VVSVY